MPILPTLPYRTPRALCSSVKKNTDSIVKGMLLFDQGGGEGRGKESWSESAPPHQSVVCLFFVKDFSDFFAGSKILAGNSPAGLPILVVVFLGIHFTLGGMVA